MDRKSKLMRYPNWQIYGQHSASFEIFRHKITLQQLGKECQLRRNHQRERERASSRLQPKPIREEFQESDYKLIGYRQASVFRSLAHWLIKDAQPQNPRKGKRRKKGTKETTMGNHPIIQTRVFTSRFRSLPTEEKEKEKETGKGSKTAGSYRSPRFGRCKI